MTYAVIYPFHDDGWATVTSVHESVDAVNAAATEWNRLLDAGGAYIACELAYPFTVGDTIRWRELRRTEVRLSTGEEAARHE